MVNTTDKPLQYQSRDMHPNEVFPNLGQRSGSEANFVVYNAQWSDPAHLYAMMFTALLNPS